MMSGFKLKRLGMIMEPEPGNPREIEGVLNPAAVRGPDGKLYLFPRLVAKGNYSRIGIARYCLIKPAIRPESNGSALRLNLKLIMSGDLTAAAAARIPESRYVEPLRHYVMTYTALSPKGPRIALAISEDLFHWKRIGLATFEPYDGIDFVHVDNKDASIFPLLFPIMQGKCNWPCSTGLFFRVPVQKKQPPGQVAGGGSRS
jgi:predicted GH43/DUF377 family glycosyl hydrolase